MEGTDLALLGTIIVCCTIIVILFIVVHSAKFTTFYLFVIINLNGVLVDKLINNVPLKEVNLLLPSPWLPPMVPPGSVLFRGIRFSHFPQFSYLGKVISVLCFL